MVRRFIIKFAHMKRFKPISTAFIIVIALIFGCNVYYLISLYNSIRTNVERDIMTALADADIDDLMYRAGRARGLESNVRVEEEAEENHLPKKAEASTYRDENGQLISVRTEADGTVVEERAKMSESMPYSNQMIDAVSRQFHVIMDKYIPYDMAVMDSVLYNQLSYRFIYPDFLCVEVVDSNDSVICSNPKYRGVDHLDTFRFNINPDEGIYYKAYMTPLTRHILSQMMGVVVTVFLLLLAFTLAFCYLFRTVSKMRTIEEMKDDFVSNMTHELKTPIAIAYSANDALLNYDTANDRQKKVIYLNIANKQLKRLGEMVESILAMSMERRKTMKLRLETIQLRPFVDEIADAQRMRGEKPITINVDVNDDVLIEADKTHLANIFNNLIDNAIKYSGDSVTITITATDEEISVADNGIGIPAKSIPYIFNKFYRIPHGNRQDVRGYGIGLYYVKSIIDKIGWSISVNSKETQGSVFTIKLNHNAR